VKFKTEKTTLGGLTYWVEYDLPVLEPSRDWKIVARGCVGYKHDTGQGYTLETETKVTFGRDEKQVLEVAKKRVTKDLFRVVAFIEKATDPEQNDHADFRVPPLDLS